MKILEEIKQQVEKQMKIISGKCIDKRYAKITDQLKQDFIEKVIQEGKTIKQSAKELCINYSSAKAIMSDYRKKQMLAYDSQTSNTSYHTTRIVQLNKPEDYDWKKFKIQTFCENTPMNEYTLERYVSHF